METDAHDSHSFDFPPRLLSWVGWSLLGPVIGLILKSMDFMLPAREAWLEELIAGQFRSDDVIVTPNWLLLLILLLGLLLLCGVITYTCKPFKTLPMLIAALVVTGCATPVLGLWGIHFFAPSLLAALVISTSGAWITSFFLQNPRTKQPDSSGATLPDETPVSDSDPESAADSRA